MTYCCGILVRDGLVMIADTRTNAGLDNVSTFRKLHIFEKPGERIMAIASAGNLHPHSGIATVTVLTEGNLRFDKGDWGTGLLDYGGVEWMRAGSAIWHGDEYRPDSAARLKGFQLWVALPEAMEMHEPEWQFVEASGIPSVGPAHLVVGAYRGKQSPVRSFDGLNYLLVTLAPDEAWTYETPDGHQVGWLSLSHGSLAGTDTYHAGELIAFDRSDASIALRAGPEGATFVLGSAVPHPHELVLGYYSVHTSEANLQAGEARRHVRLIRGWWPSGVFAVREGRPSYM